MHFIRYLFTFISFIVFFTMQSVKADIISEYMFNVMAVLGSATTCKEVINNPESAKQSVVGVIESINRLSPDNKIETSSTINKFDAVLLYCMNNPNDLLLNALLKTSNIEVSQLPRADVNSSPPILNNNNLMLNQQNKNTVAKHNHVINNNSNTARVHKPDNESRNSQGIEFIN